MMERLASCSRRWVGALLLLALVGGTSRAAADPSPCEAAIQHAERMLRLPPKLLYTIGVVESGRTDPVTRRVTPWPWTINVEGVGYFYESRADAIAAVMAAWAAGRQSIDVGCMQINLLHHPNAFATLEEAFDPQENANYAAGFLLQLYGQTRDWGSATAAYHSQTPGVGEDYRRRVIAGWSNAAEYGVTVTLPSPASRVRPGLLEGYTAEFRALLTQDAADHRALLTAMGAIGPAQTARHTARPHAIVQASLRN